MIKLYSLLLILFILNKGYCQVKSPVAEKPPMGWNSWNCFRADISDARIRSVADVMVESGMRDAGYQYLVIDDGWMSHKRDSAGHIIPDQTKFPNGIKPVADYVHSKGLKFGLYSSPGCFTCQKLMGSLGYEQVDANDYAAWGVDYLKYDWCNYPGTEEQAIKTTIADCRSAFELMGNCLKNTGRPIVYSVNDECDNGDNKGALPWVKSVANMHRTGDDIKNNWERMLYCLDLTADLWEYAGPGYWNDPDMLEVGNESRESLWDSISPVKMTLPEYKTHFSMWCMVAAPLIAGNDLRTMPQEIKSILTNRALIAIDQDPKGKQGRRISRQDHLEIWVKELSGNRLAVALLNRGTGNASMTVTWEKLGIRGNHQVTDAWLEKESGTYNNAYTCDNILGHEAKILIIAPLK